MEFDYYYLVDHSIWFMLGAFALLLGAFYLRRVRMLFDRFFRKEDEERKIVF